MAVKPIPDGYHSVTAYLTCNNCAEALAFYQQAFGATELLCMPTPDGKIGHAELMIGNSPVMFADEIEEAGNQSPDSLGGSPVSMMIYTEDCDAMFAQAIAAGATAVKPLQDQFYGDRSGTVKDPYGHVWTISTHIEDLTPEQVAERMQEMMG